MAPSIAHRPAATRRRARLLSERHVAPPSSVSSATVSLDDVAGDQRALVVDREHARPLSPTSAPAPRRARAPSRSGGELVARGGAARRRRRERGLLLLLLAAARGEEQTRATSSATRRARGRSSRRRPLLDPLRIHAAAEPGRVVVVGEVVRGRLVRAAVAVLRRVHVVAAAEACPSGVVAPTRGGCRPCRRRPYPLVHSARSPVGSSVFGSWLMSDWFIPSRQSAVAGDAEDAPDLGDRVARRARRRCTRPRGAGCRKGTGSSTGRGRRAPTRRRAQSRLPDAKHASAACLPLMYACGMTPRRETARTSMLVAVDRAGTATRAARPSPCSCATRSTSEASQRSTQTRLVDERHLGRAARLALRMAAVGRPARRLRSRRGPSLERGERGALGASASSPPARRRRARGGASSPTAVPGGDRRRPRRAAPTSRPPRPRARLAQEEDEGRRSPHRAEGRRGCQRMQP